MRHSSRAVAGAISRLLKHRTASGCPAAHKSTWQAAAPASKQTSSLPNWSWAALAAGCGMWSLATAKERQGLDLDTLEELRKDLLEFSHHADRERAVAMLSGLTLYLENHQELLKAKILPSLMATVLDEHTVPQIRNVALGSTADLMKNQEAHEAVAADKAFLRSVMAALQACVCAALRQTLGAGRGHKSQGTWADGPEDGGIARTHAARLLAELANQPGMHSLLVQSQAANAIAESVAAMVQQDAADKHSYKDISAVPGNVIDIQEVEEERYLAAALFGLASTAQGTGVITSGCNGDALRGLVYWARGRDPILKRYAVGSLARALTASSQDYERVKGTGGLSALAHSCSCPDGQTQCYAAGAIGKLAPHGGQVTRDLITASAPAGLVTMLQDASSHRGTSQGVQRGVQKCALRAIHALAEQKDLHQALGVAGVPELLEELLQDEQFCLDSDLASAALGTMQLLGHK